MKLIAVLLLALLVASQAKPVFVQSKQLTQSADKFKDYIIAFAKGLNIYGKITPSDDCIKSSYEALNFAAAGFDNYDSHNWYEGTLNISDSLGALSPLAKQCDEPFEQISKIIGGYPGQFKSTLDFFIKLGLNLLGNVKSMIDRAVFVKNYYSKGDTAQVIQTIAEMMTIQFSINKVLLNPMLSEIIDAVVEYTWTDPLAPSPINPLIWSIFEGTYNLLVSSKFIGSKNLVECEGAGLNIYVFNVDAANNFQNNKEKEGLQSVLDSFTFLHQLVEGCTNTAVEMGQRSELIDKEVFANPKVIWKNFVDNLFFVFSDGLYGHASHYYRDVISFMDAVGDFFFRTITYRIEGPQI
jgi:hypothetical protein